MTKTKTAYLICALFLFSRSTIGQETKPDHEGKNAESRAVAETKNIPLLDGGKTYIDFSTRLDKEGKEDPNLESPSIFLFHPQDSRTSIHWRRVSVGGNQQNNIPDRQQGMEIPIDGFRLEIDPKDPNFLILHYLGITQDKVTHIPRKDVESGKEIKTKLPPMTVNVPGAFGATTVTTGEISFQYQPQNGHLLIKDMRIGVNVTPNLTIVDAMSDSKKVEKMFWGKRNGKIFDRKNRTVLESKYETY